jgi:hypothetical protein
MIEKAIVTAVPVNFTTRREPGNASEGRRANIKGVSSS